jgi:hypothetical protein
MKKHLLIILITLFAVKINAQCTVATPTVNSTFTGTTLPTCWSYAGNAGNVIANEVVLASGSSINALLILPKTNNARGIITFDARRNTGTSVASPVQVGVVSASGNQASFVLIQTVNTTYSMTNYTVNLGSYAGTFQYIALRSQGPSLVSGDNASFIIDNVNYVSGCESSTVIAIAQNCTVQLNSLGTATLSANQLNNGSTSGCGTPTLGISKTSFNCSNEGVNSVTLTATDNMGNSSTTTANVTVVSAISNETVSVAQNTICSGKSATITIGASVNGINYFLRDDATNAIVAGPIVGTGNVLAFNTGSLTTNTTFNVYAETPGTSVYGLDFDGTNDVITTNITSPATNSLTVEGWIFPRATTYKRIVSNYFANAAQSGEIILDTYNTTNNGRGLRFVVEGSGNTLHQLSVANVLTLNAWNHVAGTFNNGVTTLYLNGTAISTSTAPFTSIPSCTNKVTIGEDPTIGTAEYFNGKMDEVRIWNTARTQSEIAGNMNNCLMGNESGLRNYFKLNENIGSTVTDLVTGAVGTMSGMDPNTDWIVGKVDCGAPVCNLEMTDLITITIAPNPTIAVNSGSICSGNSFTITPSGANTYTIQGGSSVKTPTANTSYTVVGTSSVGCISTTFATSSVTVNALPTINATSDDALICAGETTSLTANGTSTSYTWNTSATGTSISVSPTVTTNYTVTGTDANGCENNAVITQSVSLCTGINQLTNTNSELSIFPNPSSTNLTVKTDEEIQTISIYNSLGALVQTEKTNVFSVEQLSSGLYILKVKTEKGTQTIRFIKE